MVAAAVSFEEVVLEMLPAHRGHPEISVGNALGTLLFLLTGSLGVIALVRPIAVPEAVTSFHGPVLVLVVAILLGLLLRGRLGRPEGTVLIAAYRGLCPRRPGAGMSAGLGLSAAGSEDPGSMFTRRSLPPHGEPLDCGPCLLIALGPSS